MFDKRTGVTAELNVYSSGNEREAKTLLDSFSKATSTRLRVMFLPSPWALIHLQAEKQNPQADVWFGAPTEDHAIARQKGLTQPYASAKTTAIAHNFKDKDAYWTSVYIKPLGVGLNTNVLKDRRAVPRSWQDLLRSDYKGQIQMPRPDRSRAGYHLLTTLVQIWSEEGAFDYIRRLHPSIQGYTQSDTAASQALTKGDVAIAVEFAPVFLQLADQGQPIELIFPKEGVGFEAFAVSIVKRAPHLAAARKLVDWLLSLDGQNALAETSTYVVPVIAAARLAKRVQNIPLTDYDPLVAAQHKKRWIKRWLKEVQGSK